VDASLTPHGWIRANSTKLRTKRPGRTLSGFRGAAGSGDCRRNAGELPGKRGRTAGDLPAKCRRYAPRPFDFLRDGRKQL